MKSRKRLKSDRVSKGDALENRNKGGNADDNRASSSLNNWNSFLQYQKI